MVAQEGEKSTQTPEALKQAVKSFWEPLLEGGAGTEAKLRIAQVSIIVPWKKEPEQEDFTKLREGLGEKGARELVEEVTDWEQRWNRQGKKAEVLVDLEEAIKGEKKDTRIEALMKLRAMFEGWQEKRGEYLDLALKELVKGETDLGDEELLVLRDIISRTLRGESLSDGEIGVLLLLKKWGELDFEIEKILDEQTRAKALRLWEKIEEATGGVEGQAGGAVGVSERVEEIAAKPRTATELERAERVRIRAGVLEKTAEEMEEGSGG